MGVGVGVGVEGKRMWRRGVPGVTVRGPMVGMELGYRGLIGGGWGRHWGLGRGGDCGSRLEIRAEEYVLRGISRLGMVHA